MKKNAIYFLASMVCLAILINLTILLVRINKTYTLSEMTDGQFDIATSVTDNYNLPVDKAKIIEIYDHTRYHRYFNKITDTDHAVWTFYDENETILFQLIDLGNNNLIKIKMPSTELVYQSITKP